MKMYTGFFHLMFVNQQLILKGGKKNNISF
jgi:hypothetical protein